MAEKKSTAPAGADLNQEERLELSELLNLNHKRLVGIMGCLEGLSTSETDFAQEAAMLLFWSLDEIATEIQKAADKLEPTEVANG